MSYSAQFLNPSEAARRLGVSAKALRLYEQRGLITPIRTAAGWRAYGPAEMTRAAEIASLRTLGLSLGQVARVLGGDAQVLEPALAAHQATLEGRVRQLADTVEMVRRLRHDLARGEAPAAGELARLLEPASERSVVFDLPWPWGGERFELRDIRPLNYIIGPLGSGKTRLAKRIAEALLMPPSWAWNGWRTEARRLGRGWTPTRLSNRGSIRLSLALLTMARRYRMRWSRCLRAWNRMARPSWSSTCWNRDWTRPPRRL